MISATGDLYQVPLPSAKTAGDPEVSPLAVSSLTQTLLTSVVICDTEAAGGTFSLTVTKYEDGIGDPVSTLLNALSLDAKDTKVVTLNLTLAPGDKITGTLSADLNATAFGIEMITGSGPRG
jgi:hypothetical protein